MSAHSVAETGARPGDAVVCVSSTLPHRFRAGGEYRVVSFCGTPCVHGHTDTQDWAIPWRGWGGMAAEIRLILWPRTASVKAAPLAPSTVALHTESPTQ